MAEEARWVRAEDAVAVAGARLAEWLERVGRQQASPRLAIPGGSALAALASARERLIAGGLWSRIRLTWVDERCLPEGSAESNRGAARRAGLLDEPGPALALPLFLDGEEAGHAVKRAGEALAAEFEGGLDVVLLGMGEDGHVASLFPGRAAPPGATVAHVKASPKPPAERITLTRPVLATAQGTVLLATGEGKRGALERLRRGDPALPATGLPGLTVVTDRVLEGEGGERG